MQPRPSDSIGEVRMAVPQAATASDDVPYSFLPTLARGRRGNATQQVQDLIRDAIVRLAFTPGEFIRKDAICQRLGVSRFPVSEALGRLADERGLAGAQHCRRTNRDGRPPIADRQVADVVVERLQRFVFDGHPQANRSRRRIEHGARRRTRLSVGRTSAERRDLALEEHGVV